jgi:hypothetical protein
VRVDYVISFREDWPFDYPSAEGIGASITVAQVQAELEAQASGGAHQILSLAAVTTSAMAEATDNSTWTSTVSPFPMPLASDESPAAASSETILFVVLGVSFIFSLCVIACGVITCYAQGRRPSRAGSIAKDPPPELRAESPVSKGPVGMRRTSFPFEGDSDSEADLEVDVLHYNRWTPSAQHEDEVMPIELTGISDLSKLDVNAIRAAATAGDLSDLDVNAIRAAAVTEAREARDARISSREPSEVSESSYASSFASYVTFASRGLAEPSTGPRRPAVGVTPVPELDEEKWDEEAQSRRRAAQSPTAAHKQLDEEGQSPGGVGSSDSSGFGL